MGSRRRKTRTRTKIRTIARSSTTVRPESVVGPPEVEDDSLILARLSSFHWWAESVIQKMSYKMLLQPVTTSQQPHNLKQQPESRITLHDHGADRPAGRRRRRPSLLVAARPSSGVWLVALTIYITFYCSIQAKPVVEALGVAPTIDYSHNMRVLKLPKSTKPGEILYRLRGSDGDPNSQLHFGVAGIGGRALLDIVQVPGSWNEADVYLRSRLDNPDLATELNPDGGQPVGADSSLGASSLGASLYSAIYNLTIYVADATNKTTQVDSTILVTNMDDLQEDSDEQGSLETPGSGATSGYESQAGGGDSEEQRKYSLSGGGLTGSSLSHNHQANGSSLLMKLPTLPTMTRVNSHQLSPFIRPRHVFSVPENGQPGESIGFVTVRESDKSDLPVRFELRGRGSDHFGIRYVFGPRGQSRAELVLSQPVDYEKQNLFQLKVLALNAWTNVKYDTRNVATLDIVITVGDVQDTAPQFKQLPHALRLTNNMRPGDLVARVQAEDGDYADQRPIGYALDAGSPLSGYFTIDKQSGEIRLVRPLQELSLNQQNLASSGGAGPGGDPTTGSLLQLTVYASELPDASSYDHLWPPMFARAELPLQMVDLVNEPPQFIGGWLTETSGGQAGSSGLTAPTLRAFVREFANSRSGDEQARGSTSGPEAVEANQEGVVSAVPSQLVQWYTSKNHSLELGATTGASSSPMQQDSSLALQQQLVKASRGRPMVVDFGQGLNGTFELSLEGPDAHLFELEPSYPVNKQTLFNLFVAPNANRSLFDFDTIGRTGGSGSEPPARSFHVELVARDFGSPHRMATRLKCLIDLVDINDNAPQFDQGLYTFSIFENAQLGQILGSIRARDMDRLTGIGGVLSGQQQRVRYTSLTGRDNHLFRLDQESGLITLEGPLDREKQDHYLLLAEARDMSGHAANYTKILVNVLDVNDNAPVFSQAHYDAVLLADGTFHQPLVVSATDADEPSSANSQVAYEIIAGNQNDQFAIDSLSGAIYATGGGSHGALAPGSPTRPIQMPSILSEPILPFISTRDQNKQPDQHGKILPSPNAHGHEIEETTVPTGRYHQQQQQQPSSPLRLNWPRSVPISGWMGDSEPSSRLGSGSVADLLPQESHRHQVRAALEAAGSTATATTSSAAAQPSNQKPPQTAPSQRGSHLDRDLQQLNPALGGGQQHFDASKVPPVTTLVVRAHDFGIPLRSATCKVNIYNQALLSRSLSVILNGTAEQLEQRRELIERSFGALTGSRAQIESIDALSDSSSISVARVKLAIPAGHSLIDLTDLSALMTAIDYKPAGANCPSLQQQQQQQQNLDQFSRHPVHYITTGDRIYPIHHAPISGNISATAQSGTGAGSTGPTATTAIFTDIQSLDHASNMLERRLLFYIIIVGICILALLVIWMIYFCCREDQQQNQRRVDKLESGTKVSSSKRHHHRRVQDSLDDSELSRETTSTAARQALKGRHYKSKTSSRAHLIDEQHELAKSASQLNLADGQDLQQNNKTQAKTTMGQSGQTNQQHPIGNNLLKQQQQQTQLSIPSNIKPEHYSMYNGQVWFEQGGLMRPSQNGLVASRAGGQQQRVGGGQAAAKTLGERRASSAPSAGGHSLDSGLHAIINGRSSAFSPANSGLATPQRGQFFPNTLGYAENLATMGPAHSGGQYGLYPTTVGGGGTDGPRHRQFLGRRALVKSRGRVVPMGLVGPATGGGDYANEAFEPDLESGGLVMMPFVGGAGHSTRRGSQAKKHHRQQQHKSKTQSTSSSSSAASHSDSTRTLDEEDELDHESVLLDSDQELLGFDSTGTPIIATRTRHKPASIGAIGMGQDQGGPGLLGAPEALPGAGTSLTTSMANGASSPAATVINMSQARTNRDKDESEATSGKKGLSKEKLGEQQAKETSKVAMDRVGSELIETKDAATKKEDAKDSKTGDGATAATKQPLETDKAIDGTRRMSEKRKGDQSTKEEAAPSKRQGSANARGASLDLMSELTERLNGSKQRALKRQSADEQLDESQRTQLKQVVVDDKHHQSSDVAPPDGDGKEGSNKKQATKSTDKAVASDETKPKEAQTTTLAATDDESKRRQAFAKRRASETMSCQSQSQSIISDGTTTTTTGDQENRLSDMKNGELLEKQSIFALTYSGLATDKLPS